MKSISRLLTRITYLTVILATTWASAIEFYLAKDIYIYPVRNITFNVPEPKILYYTGSFYLFEDQEFIPELRPDKNVYCELTLTSLYNRDFTKGMLFEAVTVSHAIRFQGHNHISVLEIYLEAKEELLSYPSMITCEKKLPINYTDKDTLDSVEKVKSTIDYLLKFKI